MAVGAILAGGLGLAGLASGVMEQRNADKANKRAEEQVQREYAQRAPMRLQGMTQLGQVERSMDLGNLGYDEANPYAAARGRSPSTATYGNWDEMTVAPEGMAAAAAGFSPEDVEWASRAWDPSVQLLGKSDGAQRFGAAGSDRSQQFTNRDRERARDILNQYNQNVGFMPGTGIQALGGRQGTPVRPGRPGMPSGMQPLGGG